MKRVLIIVLAVLGLVVTSPAMADTKTVQITRNGFVPDRISVTAGDTVTWHNVDTRTHQVVSDDGSFASLALRTNDTFSQTFTTAATIRYHDTRSTARGSVLVATAAVPTPAVTLNSQRASVVFGGSVVLNGTVSNGQAGQTVALNAQRAGDVKIAQAVETTQTGAGGAFTFTVQPSIRTTYQAQVLTSTSPEVTMLVAPRITLVHTRTGLFRTSATSNLSYRGHYLLLQRRRGLGSSWVTLRKIFLGSHGGAAFRLPLKHGTQFVRVRMTGSQAGFGDIAGSSRTLRLIGR